MSPLGNFQQISPGALQLLHVYVDVHVHVYTYTYMYMCNTFDDSVSCGLLLIWPLSFMIHLFIGWIQLLCSALIDCTCTCTCTCIPVAELPQELSWLYFPIRVQTSQEIVLRPLYLWEHWSLLCDLQNEALTWRFFLFLGKAYLLHTCILPANCNADCIMSCVLYPGILTMKLNASHCGSVCVLVFVLQSCVVCCSACL